MDGELGCSCSGFLFGFLFRGVCFYYFPAPSCRLGFIQLVAPGSTCDYIARALVRTHLPNALRSFHGKFVRYITRVFKLAPKAAKRVAAGAAMPVPGQLLPLLGLYHVIRKRPDAVAAVDEGDVVDFDSGLLVSSGSCPLLAARTVLVTVALLTFHRTLAVHVALPHCACFQTPPNCPRPLEPSGVQYCRQCHLHHHLQRGRCYYTVSEPIFILAAADAEVDGVDSDYDSDDVDDDDEAAAVRFSTATTNERVWAMFRLRSKMEGLSGTCRLR